MNYSIQREKIEPNHLSELSKGDPDIPYISITDPERAKEIFVKNHAPQQWLTLRRDGELLACLHLRRTPWDSEVTGIPTARLNYFLFNPDIKTELLTHFLNAAFLSAREDGIHYIIGRFSPSGSKPLILQQAGFQILEGIVTFSINTTKVQFTKPELPKEFEIQIAEKKDLIPLEKLASESLRGGRFHAEPIIPDQRVDFLHRVWIKNSVLGIAAEKVYLCRHSSGKIAGFVTLKRDRNSSPYIGKPGLAVLDLIAVSSEFRGSGLGRALTQQALLWAKENRLPTITVTTQLSNLPAIRTYTGVGMKFISSNFTFRKVLA